MRLRYWLFVPALAALAFAEKAFAAVAVFPSGNCPSGEAIEANLEALGALLPLSQLGTAEVHTRESLLEVYFRDQRGESLGVRVVAASSDCASRAALAAAVIAAFAGEWAETKLATPAPAAKSAPQAPAEVAKPKAPVLPAPRPWQAEVGATFFALHDGDEGGFGLGARADLARGAWLATLLFEASSERERALGQGHGGYRFLRAGLGLGFREVWTRLFWEATLVPMVARFSLEGKHLEVNNKVTDWGVVLDGQTRLGWNGGRFRPFLFGGASYGIPRIRMTLVDRPDAASLSTVNVKAGIGLAIAVTP